MTRWSAALGVITLVLAGGCASATRTVIGAPRFDDDGAELLDEQVTLRCEGQGAKQRCELVADYRVRAKVPDPSATVVTHAVAHTELSEAGGVVPPFERSRGRPEGRDDIPKHAGLGDPDPDPDNWLSQRHRLDAEAGEQRALRLRAQFVPHPVRRIRLIHSPALARHHSFTELFELQPCVYDKKGCEFWVSYVHAPGHGRAPKVHGLDASAHGSDPDAPVVVHELVLHGGRRSFAPGGPFFGVGVGFEDVDLAKLRAGWEIFAPSYVAHALALELDGRRRVTMALTSELMSPMVVLLPSFGVGLGLPIQLAPELLVGVRGQLSLSLPYLGLLATVDLYPTRAKRRVSPSLFLQFAF